MIKIRFKKEMHAPQGREWLDVDLTIVKGEFVTLFGASGAGKTTFLRILAGLTRPHEGHIEVNGETWFDSQQGIDVPPQQRRVGFVSQEDTLFPHMTIRENLAYACADKKEQGEIDEWMGTMGLQGLGGKKPDQLSGGQKQRVALIRALIHRPKFLLLDEPLSDLDIEARLKLQDEILKVYDQSHITTVLVSHDLSEVFKLTKKVFAIDHGRIMKSGSPQEVFLNNAPSGKFQFIAAVIDIIKDGAANSVTLSIGNQITKIVATDEEIAGLTVGSKVFVAAKAFNPVILKS